MQHGMHLLALRPGEKEASHVDDGIKPRGPAPDLAFSSHVELLIGKDSYVLRKTRLWIHVRYRPFSHPNNDLATNRTLAGRSARRRMYQRYQADP